MRNKNFLSELLLKQQQEGPQAVQSISPAPQQLQGSPTDQQLLSALETPASSVGGFTPLTELDTREMLANSLLQTANNRDAHPLARGIAAYYGNKEMQNIAAQRGETESALRRIEEEKEALRRQEYLDLKQQGLNIQREGVDVRREQLAQNAELEAFNRERQAKQDVIAAQERARKAQIDERKLAIDEQLANATITGKQAKQEAEKLAFEENTISLISKADQTLAQIDELLKHPGFTGAVGTGFQKSIPFFGAGDIDKPGGGFTQGSAAASFVERLKQLKGGAFLEARQQLKGGGAISDTESNKAEAAVTRMSLATSEKEFEDAATEYRGIIESGAKKQRALAKKRGITLPGEQPVEATPSQGITIKSIKFRE